MIRQEYSITMSPKQFDIEGHAHFVTFCTHKKLPVINDEINAIITNTLYEFIKNGNVILIGYVIMPEHLHLVLIPGSGIETGRLIGNIKRVSAKAIHELMKTKQHDLLREFYITRNRLPRFAFWQRRCFDFTCRTEKDVWEKINYCHNNPVVRKLVGNPEDWKWSSCRWYMGLPDIALEMNLPEAWRR
jgi:putative transposase